MRKACLLLAGLFLSVLGILCPFGRLSAAATPSRPALPETPAEVSGYMAGKEPDFFGILPPFPAFDSMQDQVDVTTLWQWQHPENSRWKLANADQEMSYRRFSEAFGMEISSAKTPFLIHLLDRTEQDVQDVAFSAKSYYDRPRPLQRFQMAHVCGTDMPPAPEVPLKGGSSYPSGHSSFGWAAVLILAEVAPEHAQTLLARGVEYGESRVVCAMHYPSDVMGGQLVATAVVIWLRADAEFGEDLNCAQQEHIAAAKGGRPISQSCQGRGSRWSGQ